MPAIHIIANVEDPDIVKFRYHGEEDAAFTDRLVKERSGSGRFRQCSIGWHRECSDPYGQECTCTCHEKGLPSTEPCS